MVLCCCASYRGWISGPVPIGVPIPSTSPPDSTWECLRDTHCFPFCFCRVWPVLLDAGLASFLSSLWKALGFPSQLCKTPACFQKATPEHLKFCWAIWCGDSWGGTWSFFDYKKTLTIDKDWPKQTHSDIPWSTASGRSPLSCLCLFSSTHGAAARNTNLELFNANFSHGNSSVQKVTVQVHVLPCCFCTVDLLKKN